jgi:hypothetical protein
MCLDCGAWEYWRAVIGSTDPVEAAERTIRRKFGVNRRENAVHGSDSSESAERELSIFFDPTQRIVDIKDIELQKNLIEMLNTVRGEGNCNFNGNGNVNENCNCK